MSRSCLECQCRRPPVWNLPSVLAVIALLAVLIALVKAG